MDAIPKRLQQRKMVQRGSIWLLLLVAFANMPDLHAQEPGRTVLLGAWAPDEVGLLDASGISAATRNSFDLRLLNAVGARAGIGFVLRPMERTDIDAALAAGQIDFSLPKIKAAGEDKARILSIPYQERSYLLFIAKRGLALPAGGLDALRAALDRGLRIGIDREYAYGEVVRSFLADPRMKSLLPMATSDSSNLDSLLAGRIDGFIAPRLAGLAAIAAVPGASEAVTIVPDPIEKVSICIQFSAARVDADTVKAVDAALLSLRADGTDARLHAQTNAPILMRLAASAQWFNGLDLLGTVAFALSGVLIARREQYSLVGAFVLAALPAVGGGVVRDLLVGRTPIGVLASSTPLVVVVCTVLVSFALLRLNPAAGGWTDRSRRWAADHPRISTALSLHSLFEWTDALGLAAFTVIGVVVGVRYAAEPLWLWGPLCAALSGAGGGILRDVIRAEANHPALRTSIYAEVCLAWGLILSLTVEWLGREERPELLRLAVISTVLGAFLTRVAAVTLRTRSLRF